ncbi:hypothetical protein SAMN04487970_106221 [Paenibacillus tianmuensis]|uniref:HEAT repeat-containing protein n=1 Tax=Paenibacillus tianmuensis TaxID=624147 RepID=A0A1G4TQX3_9BACL|nr:hypothetical protein [Paenibacillus tianmuensis]SCW83730.1 hypothetical protein SAMN04487970_106221 [Paenibacillus tianmuensis]
MVKETTVLLLNTMLDRDEDSILFSVLRSIRDQYSLEELGEDFFSRLQQLLPHTKEKSTKAALIETIVEFPFFNYDREIFDEYLSLVSQGETRVEDAARCLGVFATNNTMKNEIFLRLAQFSDRKSAIEILVSMGYSDWGVIPSEYRTFAEEVLHAIKLQNRTFVISTFMFIVHPLYSVHSNISCLKCNYPTVESAIRDWAWATPRSTEYIVNSKIVTPQESTVLIKLGQLLFERVHLTPEKREELYSAFFEGKDPIDVIFTLPK